MPEEHHLYSAVQAQTSPGIQTYRDAPFPAGLQLVGLEVTALRMTECGKAEDIMDTS